MRIWRSPSAARSVTARRLRPISRWISWVRPLCRPRAASRSVRVWVERGSMPYSAVTQPRPVLRRNGGTRSSTVAVHSTWVSPNRARHEPSAYLAIPGSRLTGGIAHHDIAARQEALVALGMGREAPGEIVRRIALAIDASGQRRAEPPLGIAEPRPGAAELGGERRRPQPRRGQIEALPRGGKA